MKNLYRKGSSSIVVVILVLIVVAAGLYFYTASKQGNEVKNEENVPNTPPKESGAVAPSPAPSPVNASLDISNFAFSQASITVKIGASVTWTNKDSAPHTVTSDTGLFESNNLSTGNSYSHTFNQVGTFAYHCAYHPNMHGTITVTK